MMNEIIVNTNIIPKIRLLCRVNPLSIYPPLVSSPSSASLRGSYASLRGSFASPRGFYESPPHSPTASHNSQCCIWPLNAKNYSRSRPLPPLLTAATFRYVSQISTDEGRTARAKLSWRGLRCHQFLWGRKRSIPDISRRSRQGP